MSPDARRLRLIRDSFPGRTRYEGQVEAADEFLVRLLDDALEFVEVCAIDHERACGVEWDKPCDCVKGRADELLDRLRGACPTTS